jgi:hypothetical protein
MMILALLITVVLFLVYLYLPGKMLRRWLRSERGFKYALPASLLAVPCWLFAMWLYELEQAGEVGRWAGIFVLGFGFSAAHFAYLGVENLFLRAYIGVYKAVLRRRMCREVAAWVAAEEAQADALREAVEPRLEEGVRR